MTMRVRARTLVALAIASASLLSAPVAAGTGYELGRWAAYRVFDTPAARGIVLVEALAGGRARVSSRFPTTVGGEAVRYLVGSTAPCGQAHSSSQTVVETTFSAVFKGDIITLEPFHAIRTIRSFRLHDGDGSDAPLIACRRAVLARQLEPAASGAGQAIRSPAVFAGRFGDGEFAGIWLAQEPVGRPSGVSLALVGLEPANRYLLLGSRAPCRRAHNQTDLEFVMGFRTNADGDRFLSLPEIDDEVLVASTRLIQGNRTSGPQVACSRARPFTRGTLAPVA
jgi:hypothetical protein